jgi:hypothetical protein
MPDIKGFESSPFHGSERYKGAALILGSESYRNRVDPSHKDYNPAIAEKYEEISTALQLSIEPNNATLRRSLRDMHRKDEQASRTKTGINRGPKWDDLYIPFPVRMFADEVTHNMVYQSAIHCPHKEQESSCCSADKCGPEGVHAGERINIQKCYECTVGRLGIEPPEVPDEFPKA